MDELLARQLPHSDAAEQAILGSLLIDPRLVPEVIAKGVRPEDFFHEANRKVFELMFNMQAFARVIDPVTLVAEMREKGGFSEEAATNFIVDIMNITPTAANILEYVSILKDMSLLRGIAETGAEIGSLAMEATEKAETVLEAAERRIYQLRQGRSIGGLKPISEVLTDTMFGLSELSKNGGRIPGLSTGIGELDDRLGGFNKSDLIFVASRPGMGKTSIALNFAMHAAKQGGKAVAIFSLEMSREQLATRLLAAEAFVDSKRLQTGRLTEDDWRRIAAAASAISQTDLRIDDNPLSTPSEMSAQCRRIENLGLVIIDYLQLMTSSGAAGSGTDSRTQVVSEISRMLKIMAKELNVPVICLSQLNRANESRADKRPMLSDLRESGSIEQDADIVLGLYREGYYNQDCERPNEAECIILKNRHGETGKVLLRWMPEYTVYTALEQRYDEE